jgi:hypothetical protein
MKIIKLTRPALTDPQRHLELQAREAQAGLMDFVLSQAPPSGWLEVEILDPPSQAEPAAPAKLRRIG